MLLPCFCNDFRCYICWRPTDSVERSVHHGCQTKVSQFQAFAAICMFIHLKSEEIHTINAIEILKDRNIVSMIWTVQGTELCWLLLQFSVWKSDKNIVQLSQSSIFTAPWPNQCGHLGDNSMQCLLLKCLLFLAPMVAHQSPKSLCTLWQICSFSG